MPTKITSTIFLPIGLRLPNFNKDMLENNSLLKGDWQGIKILNFIFEPSDSTS